MQHNIWSCKRDKQSSAKLSAAISTLCFLKMMLALMKRKGLFSHAHISCLFFFLTEPGRIRSVILQRIGSFRIRVSIRGHNSPTPKLFRTWTGGKTEKKKPERIAPENLHHLQNCVLYFHQTLKRSYPINRMIHLSYVSENYYLDQM